MAKLSKDLVVGNLHPRENISNTGNLGALNAEVVVLTDGASNVSFDLRGTFTATAVVEGSVDGVNYTALPFKTIPASIYITQVSVIGSYIVSSVGFKQIRVRCSSYTSGTITVVTLSCTSVVDVFQGKVTDLSVTSTGVSAAGVTLTLPAGGTGLFHHISRIIIQRFTSLGLVAAATPIIVTTTNLPGSRAFSFPADAALIGTVSTEIVEPSLPLRSLVAATATTIVAPATTSVIWRITADYYLAP